MTDQLIKQVRGGFEKIRDHRGPNTSFELVDVLTAGFAVFMLKDPSLLAFREEFRTRQENLERVYGLYQVPGDTAWRHALDGVSPSDIQAQYKPLLTMLLENGVLESRHVLGNYSAIAIDGSQNYCSCKISCPQCLKKEHKNGKVTNYHQFLGAVLVNPLKKTVFPVVAEPIVKQDGSTKNDCELNAAKRIVPLIRESLPDESIIVTLDALYDNGPLIRLLKSHQMSFTIRAKGGYIGVQADRLRAEKKLTAVTWTKKGLICTARFTNNLVLNGQNKNLAVNYVEYEEIDSVTGKNKYSASWISDIGISEDNVEELVAVARSRWKIENETFNTLKNQGYHLEHSYGHGKKNLATNFALLAMLAFLVDQISKEMDETFKKARAKYKTNKAFYRKIIQVFDLIPVRSMNVIFKFIAGDIHVMLPLLE